METNKTKESMIKFVNSLCKKTDSFRLAKNNSIKFFTIKKNSVTTKYQLDLLIEIKFGLNIPKLVFIIQKKIHDRFSQKLDSKNFEINIDVVSVYKKQNIN